MTVQTQPEKRIRPTGNRADSKEQVGETGSQPTGHPDNPATSTPDRPAGRRKPPPTGMPVQGENVACRYCGAQPERANRADRRGARRHGLSELTVTARHHPWCHLDIGGGRPGGGRRG